MFIPLTLLACTRPAAEAPVWDPAALSVADIVITDQYLLQRTTIGKLFLRDAEGTQLLGQIASENLAVAIGEGVDGPQVALANGELATVVDGTLRMTGQADGTVVWLGTDGVRNVVVSVPDAKHPDGSLNIRVGARESVHYVATPGVHQLPTCGAIAGPTLLLGWDQGEWGGRLLRFDLNLGSGEMFMPASPPRSTPPPLHDIDAGPPSLVVGGEVYAFSGPYVANLDENRAIFARPFPGKDTLVNPPWPQLPIDRIARCGEFYVAAAGETIWRTQDFAFWEVVGKRRIVPPVSVGSGYATASYVSAETADVTWLRCGALGEIQVGVLGRGIFTLGDDGIVSHDPWP